MSNVFHQNGVRHAQIPYAVFTLQHHLSLTRLEWVLYSWLCFQVNKSSSAHVLMEGKELAHLLGVAESKLGVARAGLVAHGLILAEKSGKRYSYTLTNPDNGQALVSQTKRAFIDFNALERHQIEAYFKEKLGSLISTTDGWDATCPLHNDKRPSLHVSRKGKWTCHACLKVGGLIRFEQAVSEAHGTKIDSKQAWKNIVSILRAAGVLEMEYEEAVYSYCDDDETKPVFQVVRLSGKQFRQRRPDPKNPKGYIYSTQGCPTLVYQRPKVREAETIIVVEGERDADSINRLHLVDDEYLPIVATTNARGAGKWTEEHSKQLSGKRVIVIPDNDGPGQSHARAVQQSLEGYAAEVRVVQLPDGIKDASDYLEAHTEEEFAALLPSEWMGERIQV